MVSTVSDITPGLWIYRRWHTIFDTLVGYLCWLHNTRNTVGYLWPLAPADITEQLMTLNPGSQLTGLTSCTKIKNKALRSYSTNRTKAVDCPGYRVKFVQFMHCWGDWETCMLYACNTDFSGVLILHKCICD